MIIDKSLDSEVVLLIQLTYRGASKKVSYFHDAHNNYFRYYQYSYSVLYYKEQYIIHIIIIIHKVKYNSFMEILL